MDNINSEIKWEDGEESVEEPDGRHGCKEDKPEVEEDVNLLIDDVKWEDTQCIMSLGATWWSKLAEPAFGHLMKNKDFNDSILWDIFETRTTMQ